MIGNTNARVDSASGIHITDKANLKGQGTTTAYTLQDYGTTLAEKVTSYATICWNANQNISWSTPDGNGMSTCRCQCAGITTSSRPIIGLNIGSTTNATTVKNMTKAFGMIDRAVTEDGSILFYSFKNKKPSDVASVCSMTVRLL